MAEQYGVMVAMLDTMYFDLDRERWDLHWWGGENRLVRCRLVHPLVLAAWSGIVA